MRHLPHPDRLSREVFYVRSGPRSFVDSILARDRAFVRFDPGCMMPATREAEVLAAEVLACLADSAPVDARWAAGQGRVIDNWRVLHSRGTASRPGDRTLLRGWLDLEKET